MRYESTTAPCVGCYVRLANGIVLTAQDGGTAALPQNNNPHALTTQLRTATKTRSRGSPAGVSERARAFATCAGARFQVTHDGLWASIGLNINSRRADVRADVSRTRLHWVSRFIYTAAPSSGSPPLPSPFFSSPVQTAAKHYCTVASAATVLAARTSRPDKQNREITKVKGKGKRSPQPASLGIKRDRG